MQINKGFGSVDKETIGMNELLNTKILASLVQVNTRLDNLNQSMAIRRLRRSILQKCSEKSSQFPPKQQDGAK